ncbi:hypothetical protein ZIOFF_033036 [Zingiber officinale]|uniref:Radical SAM core domain-containing protein n=1 Tax=Zingiber officinale TaxID=94328 RepID=A0A8J5GNK2_ZINOF|nr:hypothetical protein ZIOFF_033036 [Zingiber officinale]
MALRSVFDGGALRAELESAGISPNFVPLIWKYVLQVPGCDLGNVPSLPSAAYPILRSKFRPFTSSLSSAIDSKDHLTTKLLITLQNGNSVEAVIMRYDTRLGKYNGKPRPGGPRSTLCVSSQVGCKMGCKFCATGTMGFKNNLSTGEIVEQLVYASRFTNIRNVVFMVGAMMVEELQVEGQLSLGSCDMVLHFLTLPALCSYVSMIVAKSTVYTTALIVLGMGEPLNNYAALVEAIHIMTGFPFQISPKRITVSTVGIIHAINKLPGDLPNVNLAVSLHAPDQDVRCHIMPAARAFPIGKLMDALQTYQTNTQQKIFIEYIMLDGVNDLELHAHQLGKLLETFHVVVNLIPFNPIGSSSSFKTSSEQSVTRFQKVLRGVYNIRTTIRQEMGQDISGACGQLVLNLSEQRSTGGATLLTDIEDLHI